MINSNNNIKNYAILEQHDITTNLQIQLNIKNIVEDDLKKLALAKENIKKKMKKESGLLPISLTKDKPKIKQELNNFTKLIEIYYDLEEEISLVNDKIKDLENKIISTNKIIEFYKYCEKKHEFNTKTEISNILTKYEDDLEIQKTSSTFDRKYEDGSFKLNLFNALTFIQTKSNIEPFNFDGNKNYELIKDTTKKFDGKKIDTKFVKLIEKKFNKDFIPNLEELLEINDVTFDDAMKSYKIVKK
ncbi:MAG: hypothetical protein ACK5HP_01725 [Bacilli bacterium]